MPEALLTREAREAPEMARRQTALNGPVMAELAARLRERKPAFVATCARGSSDHAATYGKYLIETMIGLPVASLGPSLASVYERPLELSGALFIAVSQSGRSPDTLRLTQAARNSGALVVGMVNDETSPLAALVDILVPLRAGPEHSIAATKTFLAACLAFLHLTASWSGDRNLVAAWGHAPEALAAADACNWGPALADLHGASSLYVIGRGLGLGIAQEMALKFKETCRIHAEAFSAAELLHGPMALVGPGFPVIVLDPSDPGRASTQAVAAGLVGLGANVHYAVAGDAPIGIALGIALPVPAGLAAPLVPLAQARAFYGGIARLAAARGLDPDSPLHLEKVTRTI